MSEKKTNMMDEKSTEEDWGYKGGPVKRMKLVSNEVDYGVNPEPREAVEQRLTICRDGRVFFSEYEVFIDQDCKYQLLRSKRFKISAESATRILDLAQEYFAHNMPCLYTGDCGGWDVEITDGEIRYTAIGSLLSETKELNYLSEMIRKETGMEDLFAFNGI